MIAMIQRLIDEEATLPIPAHCLTPRANLYELGLTSFDAIRLLVAIEWAFRVEFPRELLNRQTVASIEAITTALRAVRPSTALAKELRAAA